MHETHSNTSIAGIYKDETAYSILAKYCKIAGFPSTVETLKHVDLTPYLQLDSDLPGFVPSVAKILGVSRTEILENHSVANYFKAFSKKEIFSSAVTSLLDGKSNDLHAKLSLISNRLGVQTQLNYCPFCVKESIDKYGTTYWHRAHQLPGVSACMVHQVELLSIDRCRKSAKLPPTELNTSAAKKCSVKATLLASLSHSLLNGKLPEHLDHSRIMLAYRIRLRDLRFTTKKLRIRQRRLRQELLKFWADVNENAAVATVFSSKVEHPFPQNMFYRTSSHHPLKHLFLIGFLFGDLDSFYHAYATAEHADLYDEELDDTNDTKIRAKLDLKKRVVDLLREGYSLRKAAEITGSSVGYIKRIAISNHIPVKVRPKKIYKTEIRAIWRKLFVGHSTQKIAQKFSISVAAVEQILSAHPYLVHIRAKIRFFNARKIHREKITNFRLENATATRNVIKLKVAASYLWLFKNDKTWLYENLPLRVTTSPENKTTLQTPISEDSASNINPSLFPTEPTSANNYSLPVV